MEDDDDDAKKALSDKLAATIRDAVLGGVGYGNPPQASRFKKGKSGNPNGRPRKAAPDIKLSDQPMLESVRRVTDKKITVREGPQTREVPAYEAIVEAAVKHAINGNARYAGMLLTREGRLTRSMRARSPSASSCGPDTRLSSPRR